MPILLIFLITLGAFDSRGLPDEKNNDLKAQAGQTESGGHQDGLYGNPPDLASYIAKMEDPSRDKWQMPDKVIKALELKPNDVVCDIGAGPGYFSLKIAKALEPHGHVYAIDVDPRILDVLRNRIQEKKRLNITPVLATADHPLLPEKSCDLILIVNSYHHFPSRTKYLANLKRLLKNGGKIANIDFVKGKLPFGPPPEHKIAKEDFLTEAKGTGLASVKEHRFLPYQYFTLLSPDKSP